MWRALREPQDVSSSGFTHPDEPAFEGRRLKWLKADHRSAYPYLNPPDVLARLLRSSPGQKLNGYSWRFTRNVHSFSAYHSAVEDCFGSCSSCDSLRQSSNCMSGLSCKYTNARQKMKSSRHHVYRRHRVTVYHDKVLESKHQSKLQSAALRNTKLGSVDGYHCPMVGKYGFRLRNEQELRTQLSSCERGRISVENYDSRRCGHALVFAQEP